MRQQRIHKRHRRPRRPAPSEPLVSAPRSGRATEEAARLLQRIGELATNRT